MSRRVLYTFGVFGLISLGIAVTEFSDVGRDFKARFGKPDVYDCLHYFQRFRDIRTIKCLDEIIKSNPENEDYKNMRSFFLKELNYTEI